MHTSNSSKEGYLSVFEKVASKTSEPSVEGSIPGTMILIRSRVGEGGSTVSFEDIHQAKVRVSHLRMSDLIRAVNGANWVNPSKCGPIQPGQIG